jgi:hypothetical protein
MPIPKPRTRLFWRGKDTVEEILDRLHEREHTLVILPAGFHHALSVSVSADDRGHIPVDVVVDEAAFPRLARIKGLGELARLRVPLANAGMDMRVCTPPPRIRLIPRTRVVPRRTHCAGLAAAAV